MIAKTSASKIGFNPRSPWGERPMHSCFDQQIFSVSIHAPRGGSDPPARQESPWVHRFNPRSPWGERLAVGSVNFNLVKFQSTLPVGGATWRLLGLCPPPQMFQSTLPVGGATG